MEAANRGRASTFDWVAGLLVLAIPAPAAAQWTVTPFVGGSFGSDTEQSLTIGTEAETMPWNFGVTAGWTRGWIGADADVAYAPRFFDNDGGFIVGRQADVRYFRAGAEADETNPFGIQFDGFEFWRASAGLSFRW